MPRLLALLLVLVLVSASPGAAYTARTNFVLHCSGCHGQDGAGSVSAGVPDLRGYLDGLASTEAGRHYLMHVPGVANTPVDAEALAGIMNGLLEWMAAPDHPRVARPFNADEVTRLRASPLPDIVAARHAVARDLRARGVPVAAYPWDGP